MTAYDLLDAIEAAEAAALAAKNYTETTPVPFAPLRLNELNTRHHEAMTTIAWTVCNAVQEDQRNGLDDPWARSRVTLLAVDANELHAAAMKRIHCAPGNTTTTPEASS